MKKIKKISLITVPFLLTVILCFQESLFSESVPVTNSDAYHYINKSTYDPEYLDTNAVVELSTTLGKIYIGFFSNSAPNHVNNFIKLVNAGYYDGLLVHRAIPGYLIQTGDPLTRNLRLKYKYGRGGPGYSLRAEISRLRQFRGTVSMARYRDDVNSAGSQFFITVGTSPELDNKYTIFGFILSGMDVVESISRTASDGTYFPNQLIQIRARLIFSPSIYSGWEQSNESVYSNSAGNFISSIIPLPAVHPVGIGGYKYFCNYNYGCISSVSNQHPLYQEMVFDSGRLQVIALPYANKNNLNGDLCNNCKYGYEPQCAFCPANGGNNTNGMMVFVLNSTNEPYLLSTPGMNVALFQEAKDVDGTWKQIEAWDLRQNRSQGNTLVIKPYHYISLPAYRYFGSWKTKIRFKLINLDRVYYSNVFDGSVNMGQFNGGSGIDY